MWVCGNKMTNKFNISDKVTFNTPEGVKEGIIYKMEVPTKRSQATRDKPSHCRLLPALVGYSITDYHSKVVENDIISKTAVEVSTVN